MAHVDMFHIKDHVFLVVIYNVFMPWIRQMCHYILSLFDIVPTLTTTCNKENPIHETGYCYCYYLGLLSLFSPIISNDTHLFSMTYKLYPRSQMMHISRFTACNLSVVSYHRDMSQQ